MSEEPQRTLPSWEATYQNQAVETMPWFYPELDSVEETVYQGTLDPLPRALFCVLQREV